jgi:hypothetical protein
MVIRVVIETRKSIGLVRTPSHSPPPFITTDAIVNIVHIPLAFFTCRSLGREALMHGKTWIVTGGNSGIGLPTGFVFPANQISSMPAFRNSSINERPIATWIVLSSPVRVVT